LAGFKIMAGILVLGTILLAALPGGIVVVAGVIAKLTVVWGIGIGLIVVLAVWVGFYVGLGLALGRHAVALEGLGVFAAIERTWELCRGHRLWLFVYCFVMGVVTLAGICLCCIGVVLTRALADTAFTESFLALTREDAPGDLPLAQKP
jgi:membrane-anchored glycerophosphoryl diester phosphodiesterase (GDPDase)